MATLAKLLQVDMGLPDMAKRLAAAGRGKDSILAHINPKEAKLLKKHGGSGKINPETGIMEFQEDGYGFTEDTAYDYEPNRREITDYQAKAPEETPTTSANDYQNSTSSYQPYTPNPYKPPTPVARQAVVPQVQQPSPVVPSGPLSTADYLKSVGGSEFGTPESVYPTKEEEPSYAQRFKKFVSPVTEGAKTVTEALDPLAPYVKFGTQAYGLYRANKAANETRAEAARNEAEIRKLADPYRQQAALMQEQGQKMLTAGQQGQLTPQQQQDLETRRAVALQQQAAAGGGGGTGAQQVEAEIQRTAQIYAQQNISQGLALLSQAQNISGTADKLVQEAITAGYSGSQDANKLASEFYNAIGFSLPQTSSKGPTTGGATNG